MGRSKQHNQPEQKAQIPPVGAGSLTPGEPRPFLLPSREAMDKRERRELLGFCRRWEAAAEECDNQVEAFREDEILAEFIVTGAGVRSVTLNECAEELRRYVATRMVQCQ